MENSSQELSSLANVQPQANQALKNLAKGDTLLVQARGVSGGKVELEFAEHIINPTASGTSNPLIAMLNKSDDRFTANGPRRGWITGEKSDIQAMLGIDVSQVNEGQVVAINKVNPEFNGQRFRVLITETTKADDYQAANIDTKAKRAGKDGPFILHNGMYVFSNPSVILSIEEPSHTFLAADKIEEAVGIKAEGISVQATIDGLAV